jgi:hypothetical protein
MQREILTIIVIIFQALSIRDLKNEGKSVRLSEKLEM